MSAASRCHMVCRACFTPAVAEFTSTASETGTHIRIAEGEDGAFFVHTLCDNELEVTVTVLGDSKISNITYGWIELSQISAAGLAMEYGNNLHAGLLGLADVCVAGTGMTDDADVFLGSVNAITEDGVLVNIDGNSNRVSAYAYGPKHVILVVGLNKYVQQADTKEN